MARAPQPPDDAELWDALTQQLEPLPPVKPREPQPAPPRRLRLARLFSGGSSSVDLHGLTEDQAYRTLSAALEQAAAEGRRQLRVITGKGGGAGVLRKQVPRWAAHGPLAVYVQAAEPAPLRQGGEGAWILTLRKPGREKR